MNVEYGHVTEKRVVNDSHETRQAYDVWRELPVYPFRKHSIISSCRIRVVMAQLVLSVKIAPAEEELRDVMRFAKLHALGVFFVVVSADFIVKFPSIGCFVRIVKKAAKGVQFCKAHDIPEF